MTIKRIVIIDDHPVVVRGLSDFLREEPDLAVVGEASNAMDAITVIEKHHPDLVIIDVSLPGTNGFTLVRDVKARWPGIRVVVFSRHVDVAYAERGLQSGALAYVCKDDSPSTILMAIRQALTGRVFLNGSINEQLMRRVAFKSRKPQRTSADILSNRELEVFEAIGRGYGTGTIAEMLHVSPRTVESHRRSIKEKLGIEGLNELVRRAALWVEDAPELGQDRYTDEIDV